MFGGPGALWVTDAGHRRYNLPWRGQFNVTTSGSQASVVGSTVISQSGGLDVADVGHADTITGGLGWTAVSLAGSEALVAGGLGALFVMDNGSSDTIAAGAGFTSVDGPYGLFVRGGSGQLNFVGGAGPSNAYWWFRRQHRFRWCRYDVTVRWRRWSG